MSPLGIVVIGRNEGERLRRCLESVRGRAAAVIYVDSGSNDGSMELARSLGAQAFLLDTSLPFTAARARNEGFRRLLALHSHVEFVQFVDGDCEVASEWLAKAWKDLIDHPTAAVVCGRLRERFLDASPYNRLCDMEWNAPIGETHACGGVAMMRVSRFQEVGGYRETLIAGEEPELCLRLRKTGATIRRIDVDMSWHDAAMTRFGQWWKRSLRAGHAFAECSWLHRAGTHRLWVRETRSTWFWGLVLPAVILLASPMVPLLSLLLLLAYGVLGMRVFRYRRRLGDGLQDARLYAFFCVLAKFPQVIGQLRFHGNRLFSRRGSLIEYKDGTPSPAGKNKVKVAYLINQYPHVSHSFIRREIRALEEQGITVERFSIRRPPVALVDPADEEERERTHVLLDEGVLGLAFACLATLLRHPIRWLRAALTATRMGWHSGRGLYRHWAYLTEACVLLRRLRRSASQHLHAHFGTNAADVALLTRILGGPPYSFTIHGPEEFDRPERLSLGRKIADAAFVVAVSEFGHSQVFRWCSHHHWSKVHVIRCGVDRTFLGEGTHPVPDTNTIVCVGRLCEQKGQLRLLEALAMLSAEGLPVRAVLAGDGPMRKVIEDEVRRLGLQERVHVTGWLSGAEVRQHLLDARVMVLPSFAEGLPVVLMEALALGRPVITTYIAGIPELVQPGVNGWLIPAGSVEALAEAIRQALGTETGRLTEMGRTGAAAVVNAHDAVEEAKKLGQLLAATREG
jgi:glycosyltransferase involved in cell wall biosynthesis/GT2 family glycosyltransferase